ncbi:hypothetical protein ACFU6R_12625, partial [Streptomyces sp. NPDC057499]
EENVPLIDLSASSRAYLDSIGPEEAKSVFLHVPAGVYPNRPTGTVDDTPHTVMLHHPAHGGRIRTPW